MGWPKTPGYGVMGFADVRIGLSQWSHRSGAGVVHYVVLMYYPLIASSISGVYIMTFELLKSDEISIVGDMYRQILL